ncbi:hypothetical protein FXO38_16594 [Capsicum annuum]|uniref:Uncharacterized protein n=1 Tax=Capsicum annuum TaxID=4072 RepID=A0A2G2ZNF7_CAPAN|nr:hypothetical protein FXO38_16594 [Capsicum annuum]KAF3655222.1 hypothetical protein FXO37_16062 [Capsicum annuum]PHT83481.1 hypothetical protein T459_11924 [Capsicum annuum]
MTTNIVKLLNSVLTDERKYPVSYIFNLIAKKFVENFMEWHAFVGMSKYKFVDSAKKILRDNKRASNFLYVTNANGDLDQYIVLDSGVTAKVNLLERSCSYRKYGLVKLSYEHPMANLQSKYGDGEGYGNSIYE